MGEWSFSGSNFIWVKVMNGALTRLAISTKSFHASGLPSPSQTIDGISSVTYPGRRMRPWPSIKATMSSFSEVRLSVLIVKQSFSQMGLGPRLVKCGNLYGAACSLRAEGVTDCLHLNTTFLSATMYAQKALHGHLVLQMGRANCIHNYN